MTEEEANKLYEAGTPYHKEANLVSDKETRDYIQTHDDEISTVKRAFLEDLKKNNGMVKRMYGAFSPEQEGSDAYIEKEFVDNGAWSKLYGCSFMHKSHYSADKVRGLQLSKALVSDIPRNILGRSWLYSGAFLLRFLFQRNRFWQDMDDVAHQINVRAIQWYDVPESHYHEFEKELARAWFTALRRVFGDLPDFHNQNLAYEAKKTLPDFLFRISRLIFLVLHIDNAYRLRFKDAFSNDYRQFLVTLMERETSAGIGWKWRFIYVIMSVGLLFSPKLERFLDEFFGEIDPKKMKMDESDHYFSLLFKSYNPGGVPLEEREREWNSINRRKHHVFL